MTGIPDIKWMSHSSHPQHPLKQAYKNTKFRCDLCRASSRGLRLLCDECNFALHDACSVLPATLPSAFFAHPRHPLHLNTTKPSLLSFHDCRLCRHSIRGAAYECTACDFFLHPLCSRLPETVSGHDLHPIHPLTLKELPASGRCDVCDEKCRHWRYCCEACDVHIHMECLAKGIDAVKKEQEAEDEMLGSLIKLIVTVVGASSGN